MKWYSHRLHKTHVADLHRAKLDDKRKQYCLKFVSHVANSFPREYPRIGILNLQDLTQYGYLGLLQSWDRLDWDRIGKLPIKDQQAMIWKFIKNGIKYGILHGIMNDRDTVRIPQQYYIKWHDENTDYKYNIDVFLTKTFSSFLTPEAINALDDGGNYVADQINEFLDEVMDVYLSDFERIVIKQSYGIDEPLDQKRSVKRIAEYCSCSEIWVKKTKAKALRKLREKEVKKIIENFITKLYT